MNSESDLPGEKVLKDWAGARRRAFGPPPAMPEHVRSRLHREISGVQMTVAPGESGVRSGWWRAWLRPWVWAGAGVGLVLMGIWLVRDWRAPAQVALVPAAADGRSAGEPARKVEAAPSSVVVEVEEAVATRAMQAGSLRANSETAAPAPTPAPTSAPVARPVAKASGGEGASRLEAGERVAMRARAVGGPSGGVAVAGAEDGLRQATAAAPAALASYRDGREATPLQQRFVQNQAGAAAPVLGTFQVDQVGTQLRLVDADGSVYLAALGLAGGATPGVVGRLDGEAVDALAPGEKSQMVWGSVAEDAPAMAGRGALGETQALALRATGTNRQSQQAVVFTGNLWVSNVAGMPAIMSPDHLATNVQALRQLFSNSSLSGQVTIAGTNQFTVEAVPVLP